MFTVVTFHIALIGGGAVCHGTFGANGRALILPEDGPVVEPGQITRCTGLVIKAHQGDGLLYYGNTTAW